MNAPTPLTSAPEILNRGEGAGIPQRHRLSRVITEAMTEPMFAAQWSDTSDESFRPFAVAVIELRNAKRLTEKSRQSIYRDLCSRKRVEVLSDIAGKRIPAKVLKLLGRTSWQKFSRGDWNAFLSIASLDGNSELGHVPRITPTLVRQFALIPKEIRLPGLLSVVSSLQVPAERWDKWQGFINRADAGQQAEFRHAAGTINSRGDLWDLYFRCEGKYSLPFSLPATLSNSNLLEPIVSPQEMEFEAILMRNCLANRISRVHNGNRIFFRLRDRSLVTAELVRQGPNWVPGSILGFQNSSVAPVVAQHIGVELQRLAKSISAPDKPLHAEEENSYITELRQFARESFAPEVLTQLVAPLQSIQAKSVSWSDGAYAIFELKRGGYVQFMSSPDGNEYLLEICSHKYWEEMNDFLTADVVDLIEKAGFVWPTKKSNFLRWFSISSQDDIQEMAEIALAILSRVFKYRKGWRIMVNTHIPA